MNRYMWQPRQKSKAEFRNAAASANAAKTIPRTGRPAAKPSVPTAVNTMPTPWEKRGGASGSVLDGGPSRGRTRERKTSPYGAYRSPASAPTANTSVWAASSQPAAACETPDRTRTTATTSVVMAAPNRGARESMGVGTLPGHGGAG